jgi:hypothetical protein
VFAPRIGASGRPTAPTGPAHLAVSLQLQFAVGVVVHVRKRGLEAGVRVTVLASGVANTCARVVARGRESRHGGRVCLHM